MAHSETTTTDDESDDDQSEPCQHQPRQYFDERLLETERCDDAIAHRAGSNNYDVLRIINESHGAVISED